ncbi:MAG: hypothetical protein G01um101448_416 [Parcubacteria group bacterium Gr01-1014_48]|nr:MAG: hypothetical protein Greene041614_796 [Parcubacteria group bacterium Greene0416_14]TSC73985.1 MAG: hypothetical protein G01um101448_416 [Parcubacteria group bacterium Gr01-1014_48]TSD00456.1 MAG: hypothetical protein Greene101415_846 [Parcubacteria group bacterium Greene1014_15]TSD07870.1 MAG: hypothetical protein Greene07144_638 [Parcubacteria group bacterium Greene0714_4]
MHVRIGALRKILPHSLLQALLPLYHYVLALSAALYYKFPSGKITVIAVTGTKGKTSTTELINAILEETGYKTAVLNTVRFKVGSDSKQNLLKMTMPGRFFVQKFLRDAITAQCSHAIIEMTSEGARQYRHKFIALDALVFTNIAPEHIESHGSFQNYLAAKLSIAAALEHSPKKNRVVVANMDDVHGHEFLACRVPNKVEYRLADAAPYILGENGATLHFRGMEIRGNDPGIISIYNILAAASLAIAYNLPIATIKKAIEKFGGTRGRLERIEEGQSFPVIVDYAHTLESLRGLYEAFGNKKRICVFGGTGGGRDSWKRPQIGALADEYCTTIILTDEDPYDENSEKIVRDIASGIKKHSPIIEMDRRKAIRTALQSADMESAVFITGKGTDPYIMRAHGTRELWDDATVAREELQKIRET